MLLSWESNPSCGNVSCPGPAISDKYLLNSTVQACPDGYPLLAAFLDSDDNFMHYRQFGYLQARLLLEKQNQLRLLEEDLDVLDDLAKQSGSRELTTREDIDSESGTEHRERLEKMKKAFKESGERAVRLIKTDSDQQLASLLQAAQALTHCNRPSSDEYSSVEHFFDNREPLASAEQGFIYHKEDLITLRPGREHAWLDSSIEKGLKWLKCDFIRVSHQNEDVAGDLPSFPPDRGPWLQRIAVAMALGLVPSTEALPTGQRGKPIDEQASQLAQLGMSLASIVAVVSPVAGLQYGACKLIDYGAHQKPEEERAAHLANSHLAWSLVVSFADLYVIRDDTRSQNPLIFYATLALNVAALEIFREHQFAYFSSLGFGHRALSLGLGTALALMLYALGLLHCVPLAFWASIAAPPYLARMGHN